MSTVRGSPLRRLRLVAGECERSAEPRAPSDQPERGTDDIELLAAVQHGDRGAATELHDRVRPVVDRTIGGLLGRHDAQHEELAQITMIELVRSLTRFRGDCSLDVWTMRIAARTVYRELRTRTRRKRIFSFENVDEDTASFHDLEADTAHRQLIGRVRAHLDDLDPNKAWTFVLHDVEGYDLREISEITGVSIAAAQSRLVRGRKELHARIANDPELASFVTATAEKTP